MRLSFIIPAHNEQDLLGATLASIRAGAGGFEHEIIVADDGSTDATGAIAMAAGARVVRHERRQIAATRNLGARAATGDILLFVDADTRISPEVVRQAIGAIEAGAVGGGAMVRFDGRIPRYASVLLAIITITFRLLRFCGGCFVFCTREAFEACGGWDERLYASEEGAFAMAMKRRGRFVIIRARVVTSGRKLRAYTPAEIFGTLARMILSGGRLMRQREALDIWYAPRRPDPGAPPEP